MTPEMLGESCFLQLLPTASQPGRGDAVTQVWRQVAGGGKGHQRGGRAAASSEGHTRPEASKGGRRGWTERPSWD